MFNLFQIPDKVFYSIWSLGALKVTFHMSEHSFSALKETLKWTGMPWAPLLTCLRATHRMAAEANRYQSPGFCQTRRHAPRPWVLLVDTGDWRMLVMKAWLCLSVPISCRKARWLLLKWAGLGRSLLSPQCVGGQTGGWGVGPHSSHLTLQPGFVLLWACPSAPLAIVFGVCYVLIGIFVCLQATGCRLL